MTSPASDWYAPLRDRLSLARQAARPGSLGALAAHRRATGAQYFTPDAVARVLWDLVSPAIERAIARSPGSQVSLLDTSVGIGRLFQFANPQQHRLAGVDIHAESVHALHAAAVAGGFEVDLQVGSLAQLRPRRHGCALLNPPFSILLESPVLEALPCASFGRFGAGTSALSHEYALEQALNAADIVAAVLPTPHAQRLAHAPEHTDRLRAVLALPPGSFREEGTDVDVSVVVFGRAKAGAGCVHASLGQDRTLPALDLDCRNTDEATPAAIEFSAAELGQPVIVRPVTGDRAVRIAQSSRRLTLGFRCGLTEAKVRNALLERPLHAPSDTHRYPRGLEFKGEGWFEVDHYLVQPDPMAALDELHARIRDAGGEPVEDPGLRRYFARRARRHQRQSTPLRHVVQGVAGPQPGDRLEATVRHARMVDPLRWGSALLRVGEKHELEFTGSHFRLVHPRTAEVLELEPPEARTVFDMPDAPESEGDGWRVAHAGRLEAFPQLAHALRARLTALGVDQVVSWDYQSDDVVEMLMAPGAIAAWSMGLGKCRLALALALMGGRRNLVAVDAHLVSELLEEVDGLRREIVARDGEEAWRALGLDDDQFQVITTPEQARALKRVNVISYSRLKATLPGSKRTMASLLRRRIATMVCDEVQLMRNPDSDQARAVWQVSAKRRYGLSGTPIPNYARDLLQLAFWAMGDAIPAQPYGRFRPCLEGYNLRTLDFAQRGVDRFAERHVVLEWVSHEFQDGLRTGAKREVPRIRNLAQLREWAAPILRRRVAAEPQVRKHFHIPEYDTITTQVPWDRAHLAHVLRISDEFKSWYLAARKQANHSATCLNTIAVLARIGALQRAVTYPQHPTPGFGAYGPATSKQRALVERARELSNGGHKTIVFVEQPAHVEQMVRELASAGIEAVAFHGKLSIAKRTRALNERFRRGPAPVLVATLGTGQTGLNLYQADRALFACYTWTAYELRQAMARLLRPQQRRRVLFEFFELAGSLDCYMAQMVSFKADCADAAIDFLTPQCMESEEFLHLDRILDAFVESLADAAGLPVTEFRERAKAA